MIPVLKSIETLVANAALSNSVARQKNHDSLISSPFCQLSLSSAPPRSLYKACSVEPISASFKQLLPGVSGIATPIGYTYRSSQFHCAGSCHRRPSHRRPLRYAITELGEVGYSG